MNKTVTLIGARGGHGTSTVTAVLALAAAEDIPTTILTHDPVAMARLLGATPPMPTEPFVAAPNLTVAGLDGPRTDLTIVDAGSATTASATPLSPGERYAIVRGPCYLALATLVSLPDLGLDGVILVAEPGRALSAADASAVLGLPVVATVPVRSSIARLIDAGLLAGRPSEVPGLEHLRDALIYGMEPAAASLSGRVTGAERATIRRDLSHEVGQGWEHTR
jgi:hypothetical protein